MNITGYKNKKKSISYLKRITELKIDKIKNSKIRQDIKNLAGKQCKLERLEKAKLDCSKQIKRLRLEKKKRK